MKKKFLLALCVLAIATLLFALTANAAEPVITWDISATENDSVIAGVYNDNGISTLIISGTGAMKDFASADSTPWSTSIDSVVIEEGVTNIGDAAFSECEDLTSVSIADSVTSIGGFAFYYCGKLESIEIPEGVTYIGTRAFESCSGLSSVNIPSGMTSISKATFYGCESIRSITIPDSITTIGDNAFSWCYRLKSITIPDSVTSIGVCAFEYCYNMASVYIPSSVTSIREYAFVYCENLTIYCEAPSKPSTWSSYWNYYSRPVVWGYFDEEACLGEIFTFKGYSFSVFGSMAIGFTYNDEAVAEYEEKTGKALEIGVVFALYDTLNGKTPLDESGEAREVEGGVVIKGDLTGTDSKHFDFVLTDIDESSRDVKLVISAYIYTGDAVYYVQGNGLSDTVTGVSFNEATK